MNLFLNLGVAVLAVVVMYVVFTNVRHLHTITLIAQAQPYEQPGDGRGRILVLGDSTGYGTGATNAQETIAGRLGADFPGYAIENRSVNGDTIADAAARARTLSEQYDLVLLQLGANDILQDRPVEESTQDLQRLLDTIFEHTDRIVMISAGNVGASSAFSGERAEAYTQQSLAFHAGMAAFAERTDDFTYVNLYEPPESDPFVSDPESHLSRDGLHPSGTGYGVWYETLRPTVVQVLERSE